MTTTTDDAPVVDKKDEREREKANARALEQERLWRTYRLERCSEARNLLVEVYQGFVREITRHFAGRLPPNVDRADLLIAANMGLMSAIEAFDPERGVRFESYCELRVKGALLDELRAQDWLPRPWRQRLEAQKRTVERLCAEHGREPRDEDVAREMDMPLKEYQQTFGTGLPGAPPGSMPVDDAEDDGLSRSLEGVPDTTSDAPGEKLSRDELLRLVAQRLTDQEYRIVYLKYWEGLPMREIGQLTGLSESRVCKIHQRLLERLKDRLRVE